GYAMQQMRNGDLAKAKALLTASLEQPVDEAYEAAAYFWKGDIAHRQNKPAEVLSNLKQFVNRNIDRGILASISPQATFANAYLNLGYAAMEMEDYGAAQTYFAKAKQGTPSNSTIAINASVREADAAFMQKNFKEASDLYDKIIAANTSESDYAILQKGILLGVQGKSVEKTNLLHQLINKFPPSKYSNDARYELGSTLIEDNKYQQAITLLEPLTTNLDARNYAAKAWMKIGFAYQEIDNNLKAMEAYKNIIANYPASEERVSAIEALRSLYMETNQPEAYAKLVSEYGLPAIGSETMDSTYYATAEAQVAAGRWANAKTTLTSYLEKYPNGLFTTHAHYYKAESHFQLKEYEAALTEYDAIFSLPWNEFSESSAKRAADAANKLSNYEKAAGYYALLRNSAMSQENLHLAYSGMMRSYYNAGQFERAANYADTLLAMPVLEEAISNEVNFFKARSLQRSNKTAEALALYQQLEIATNESIAAEARYRIAEILLQQNNLKEAELAAANALKLNVGNEYWSVKSYLLIADILIQQKDYFNAKATLQSVVKNTKNTELKKEASQKLDEVKRLEKQKSKLKEH
ncbi:MAG TPA: tetratricopeptide repeat protein, partial [Flavipsychrobacter sp.]|nr:tetratricopeptide repeat protein [Flavipsychrobacter sp.]